MRARELEQFFRRVEQRAFHIARIRLRHEADALDAVQEAMIRLARRYAQRSPTEWPPLFYRILQNCVRDIQRGRQGQSRLFAWLPWSQHAESPEDASLPQEASSDDLLDEVITSEQLLRLEQAIAHLPERQQQAFMLRTFEGLDVRQTAIAMGCSEGSVKTHYSRAVHSLRQRLEELT